MKINFMDQLFPNIWERIRREGKAKLLLRLAAAAVLWGFLDAEKWEAAVAWVLVWLWFEG